MKFIIPFRSYPTRSRKFEKSSEKIQKIKKYDYGFISWKNMLEKTERERKKELYPSVSFLPDPK